MVIHLVHASATVRAMVRSAGLVALAFATNLERVTLLTEVDGFSMRWYGSWVGSHRFELRGNTEQKQPIEKYCVDDPRYSGQTKHRPDQPRLKQHSEYNPWLDNVC